MMDQFYTSRHGAIVYLCVRADDMLILCGYVVAGLA